jgi:DNA repair protein RadC
LTRVGHASASQSAARLIDEFGSLASILAASRSRLLRATGERSTAHYLWQIGETLRLSLRHTAFEGNRITGTAALATYLGADMGQLAREQIRVLFLSGGNQLVADEILFQGSVDSTSLDPRPIVHRALDLAASGLIIVHNHPSGKAEPSRSDLAATRRLAAVSRELEITLHDHIIVARYGWSSFRDLGLL